MAALIRWDPVRPVSLSDAVERFLENSWWGPATVCEDCPDALALDLYETADKYVVTAALPGVKAEEVDVHVENDELTIRGESKREEKGEEARYHWQERWYGQFERRVLLPTHVVADKVEANLKDGVLTIEIPKAEEVKPKRVTVNVK